MSYEYIRLLPPTLRTRRTVCTPGHIIPGTVPGIILLWYMPGTRYACQIFCTWSRTKRFPEPAINSLRFCVAHGNKFKGTIKVFTGLLAQVRARRSLYT